MSRLRSGKRRLLESLARITASHPVWVLLVGGGLTAGGLFVARGLEVRSDLADFLPDSSPAVMTFRRTVDHFGTSDHLIVAIQGEGEEDAEVREYLADILAEKLLGSGRIQYLDYRVDLETLSAYRESLLPYAWCYLEESAFPELERKLSDAGIREQIRENRRQILSPASPVAKKLVRLDPLGLRTLYHPLLGGRTGKLRLDFRDGYLFSEDLRLLLMIAKPVRPAQDIRFTRELVRQIREFARESRRALIEEGEDLGSVRIGFTGGYPLATDYEAILRKDILATILTASLGVLILFSLSFRSAGSVLYVGLPLLAGLSWTAAFTAFTVGGVNLFTGASVTVLMGLEVDFAIHLLNRYREARGRGRNPADALVETLGETGAGILTAASTSVAAFYSTLAAEFRGLVQLGLICGTGMVLCLAANFTLIPSMLVLVSRWEGVRGIRREPRSFGLEGVARWVTRRPVPIILGGILLTLVLGNLALSLRLEPSLKALRPTDSPSVRLQKEVVERIGSPFVYTMIVTRAGGEEEALHRTDRIARRLERLVGEGTLISYSSLRTLLPPFPDQRRNLRWLDQRRRENPDAFDVDRILRSLRSALREEGFREEEEILEETSRFLRSAFRHSEPIGIEALRKTPLETRISRFARRTPTGYEIVTYAYPDPSVPTHEVNRLLEAAMADVGPGSEVVSVGILGREINRLLRRDGILITGIAFVAVVLMVYLDFRRWRYVLLAGIPVVTGVTWTLGLMELFDISFNMVNLGILPILLGIGVDDGIHIMHRFVDGKDDVVQIFHKTGRAVLITTLTTVVGFGTLVFADYPGLVTAGIVAILGMGCCLVSSVTLLPALLWKFGRPSRPLPGRRFGPASPAP